MANPEADKVALESGPRLGLPEAVKRFLLETVVHVGTHVDSPRHFYADGPEWPLCRLID